MVIRGKKVGTLFLFFLYLIDHLEVVFYSFLHSHLTLFPRIRLTNFDAASKFRKYEKIENTRSTAMKEYAPTVEGNITFLSFLL